ncbi:hypothetical protein CHLRE_16g679876v5 [Chlamydomonas reinhardtii]|uniref:Potassium channel tetramerisation-type BTB domain-containing protein n=1 Tax=Chlamydomonas reinhardtii TaxID=3055 RepID=A0A2K3CU20_CHLRE|nr:uncharacterized protein CHLRE_16g679876v5 [Chlamydomonas reinhardtii]PNW71775.1 hypothetical protein CHLRE_16g679876v5 [Chlamydomonas reinhardtii]
MDGTPKSAAANGTAPASGAAPPATSSIFGPAAAAAGPSSEATSAAAAATAADDLALQFAKLTEAVDAKMKALAERERSMAAAAVRLSAANERMSSVLGQSGASDVIRLNVGGTALATSRRTLTLVPDSLLATMFSGGWDDHLTRDPTGAVFLDYDPHLFAALVNWLRGCDLAGPEAPLAEVRVEQDRQEQLLVLVDFLQLQRHVPCRFTEIFSPTLSSPYIALSDSTGGSSSGSSTTTACGYQTVARRTGGGGGSGAYAVAAAAHSHFDTHVEVVLEVERFGAGRAVGAAGAGVAAGAAAPAAGLGADGGANRAAAGAGPGGQGPQQPGGGSGADEGRANQPMFVGVMCRGQLAGLDQSKRNTNATWESTCHGWWTHRRSGSKVQGGRTRLLGHTPLWVEGDTLVLSLDAARRSDPAGAQAVPATAAASTSTSAETAPSGAGAGGGAAGQLGGGAGGAAGQLGGGGSVELSLTNCRTQETLRLRFSPDALGGASEEQWVVMVGMAGVGDCVRIASARRPYRR